MSDVYGFRENKSRARVISKDDDVLIFEGLLSGINISANGTYTYTYTNETLADAIVNKGYKPIGYLIGAYESPYKLKYCPAIFGFNSLYTVYGETTTTEITVVNPTSNSISNARVDLVLVKVN